MPFIFDLKSYIVFPLISFFSDKGDTIDIEKKENLESFFVLDKVFVISNIFYNNKLFFTSIIFVNFFSFRNFVVFLLGFFFSKLLFFVEILSPPIVGNVIITALFSKHLAQIFDIFF